MIRAPMGSQAYWRKKDMKVKCIAAEGYAFSRKKVREGSTLRTTYNNSLKLNAIYDVHGMNFLEEGLRYLIVDENEMPTWNHIDLFEIVDSSTPDFWHFNFWGYQEYGASAVWGYYELAYSYEHLSGLSLEKTKKDYELFMERTGVTKLHIHGG